MEFFVVTEPQSGQQGSVGYNPWTKCHKTDNDLSHALTDAVANAKRVELISPVFGQVLREQRIARDLSQE